MLFEQIEAVTPEKSQGKLGVNLGIINGEISCSEKFNDGYIRKLEVVLENLKARKLIGDIKEHKEYIHGPLLMGWETFDITHWGTKIAFHEEHHLYIVTLFGSKENVIGTPYKGEFDSHSIYPDYVNFAKENFESDEITDLHVWQLMEGINMNYTGELLPYEFVAKVLYRETLSYNYREKNNRLVSTIDPFEKTTYILATPIYVSLPRSVVERVRRIDGKNYVVIDLSSMRLKTKRDICKTSENLIITLKNAALLEEADCFRSEIEELKENITEQEFIEIVNKYFIIN